MTKAKQVLFHTFSAVLMTFAVTSTVMAQENSQSMDMSKPVEKTKTLPTQSPFTSIDHSTFESIQGQKPLIIDVRTPEEFSEGHVPGAVNIPVATIPDNLFVFADQDRPVVMYCRSGRRAANALNMVAATGHQMLFHLEGDMAGWEKANKPIEKPAN